MRQITRVAYGRRGSRKEGGTREVKYRVWRTTTRSRTSRFSSWSTRENRFATSNYLLFRVCAQNGLRPAGDFFIFLWSGPRSHVRTMTIASRSDHATGIRRRAYKNNYVYILSSLRSSLRHTTCAAFPVAYAAPAHIRFRLVCAMWRRLSKNNHTANTIHFNTRAVAFIMCSDCKTLGFRVKRLLCFNCTFLHPYNRWLTATYMVICERSSSLRTNVNHIDFQFSIFIVSYITRLIFYH